jgi:hypothetical protein
VTIPPPVASTHCSCSRITLSRQVAFETPVSVLTVEFEQRGESDAGGAFDFTVELDKWYAEPLRSRAPERGLAGAAQTDQRDAAATLRRLRRRERAGEPRARRRQAAGVEPAQKLGRVRQVFRLPRLVEQQTAQRHLQRAGQPAQQQHRDVAAPALQLGDIAFRESGLRSQRSARHAAFRPQFAHALAEPPQKAFVAVVVEARRWSHRARMLPARNTGAPAATQWTP